MEFIKIKENHKIFTNIHINYKLFNNKILTLIVEVELTLHGI